MVIQLSFRTVIEDQPGAAWRSLFEQSWPAYRAWFLRSGGVGQPGYLECRRALRRHMPQLVSTWEALVELAGGGDVESRFLSMWCPPPYIGGCSQAVWFDAAGHEEPALLRNYDFAPLLLEGSWLATRWTGQRVAAMGDCLWGALDGVNEAGLAAALSFGGRTVSGEGFGIPLLLRHVLEVAHSTAEGIRRLQQVPASMCYSITLLDRHDDWATVFVAPDRPTEVTRLRVVTNFQHEVEWAQHAQATHAVQRRDKLQSVIDTPHTLHQASQALLHAPLYQHGFLRGHGTLYGAVYRPRSGRIELLWPHERWAQSLVDFRHGQRDISYATPAH